MKTYCENISETEMALHAQPEEMAFVLDLVNSIDHPVATKLRNTLQSELRSNDRFKLIIDRKIEVCEKCKGEGTLLVGNMREMHNLDKDICPKCNGERIRMAVTCKRYEAINGAAT